MAWSRAEAVRRGVNSGGVAILALTCTTSVVLVQGFGSPASAAPSTSYELYCPGTPVGNVVMNSVATSGTITPVGPASRHHFKVTGYQISVPFPQPFFAAAAALGNREVRGTATTTLDASGATPSSVTRSSLHFATPIPNPLPTEDLIVHVPSRAKTIGVFTASGGRIAISQDEHLTLRWLISGSRLNLACTAYPNNSEPTGITDAAPVGTPIAPLIATSPG